MIKRMLIMLVTVAIVLGGVFGFKAVVGMKIKEFMSGMGNMPQTVSTATAVETEWQDRLEAVGSLRAVRGADLSLEVPGIVEEINFQSGDDVEAGKVLLKLRDNDEVAKLHSLEAMAKLYTLNYERNSRLLRTQAVAQSTVDNDAANLQNFQAQVDQQKAMVEKKTLRAPFAGRLGLRQIDLGQYLAAGTVIATLQALTPIYADFFLPQQDIAKIKVGQAVTAKVDTYPGELFKGTITAINPKIDTGTRNVQVRATLDNDDRRLLPGMHVSVAIAVGAPQQLVTLPQTAISYNPYGNLVYVVDNRGKDGQGKDRLTVHQVFVTLGATRGDQVAVLKGVGEGQVVVTGGQMKLRNGVPITVNNTVQPANDAHPQPVDR
ncbi:MAG: efflux RND transporter periplasmic adaptor subunit [Alphaproteobacteria bacterium]|nr:efflux RND transporter periplasmic adaptor subunit [Alphaproteobacteria bacterium]MBV8407299.1 efflux RND transporter periplasmic adaptor subunit [Alphaproteobacteria bacterium]